MKVDSVPVDTCANLTLVAAWETHKNHTNGRKDLKVGTFYKVGSLSTVLFRCTTTSRQTMCRWNGASCTTRRRPTWWGTPSRGWSGSLGEASSRALSSTGKSDLLFDARIGSFSLRLFKRCMLVDQSIMLSKLKCTTIFDRTSWLPQSFYSLAWSDNQTGGNGSCNVMDPSSQSYLCSCVETIFVVVPFEQHRQPSNNLLPCWRRTTCQ